MSKPSKHNCQLLDVDQDGIKDCVVVGENGLMTAINPINGKLITLLPMGPQISNSLGMSTHSSKVFAML